MKRWHDKRFEKKEFALGYKVLLFFLGSNYSVSENCGANGKDPSPS